jgi:hypothetical protein
MTCPGAGFYVSAAERSVSVRTELTGLDLSLYRSIEGFKNNANRSSGSKGENNMRNAKLHYEERIA